MNYEKFASKYNAEAKIAQAQFGEKNKGMDFYAPTNGFLALIQSGQWLQYYWLGPNSEEWKEHHLIKDENWLSIKERKIS